MSGKQSKNHEENCLEGQIILTITMCIHLMELSTIMYVVLRRRIGF